LIYRQQQRRQAQLKTAQKALQRSQKSKLNTDPERALERAGVWAAGSLFLDDLDRLLEAQDAKLGLHWGVPGKGMKTMASLYLQKAGQDPEVFQILLPHGTLPQIQQPGDLTERLYKLLDIHQVEIGIRWKYGIPIVQLAERNTDTIYALVLIEGQLGKRVVYEGQ